MIPRPQPLLWNIFASGLPRTTGLGLVRKYFLLNLIGVLGSIFLGFFSFVALLQQEYVLALADGSLLLAEVTMVFLLRARQYDQAIAVVGTILTGFFYLFLIFYGGLEKPTYLWALTYPLIALYLLGRSLGSVVSLTLLITSCLFSGKEWLCSTTISSYVVW